MIWTAETGTKLFNYCERGVDPAFWAEPLNALSNAGFLVVSLAAFLNWRRQPAATRGGSELALIALVLVIGIGSFLFHTFATRWAMLADTVPIGIFMLAYFAYALRRLIGLDIWPVLAGLVLFVTALAAAGNVKCGGVACLNGSVGYLPAFAAIAGTGEYLRRARHPSAVPLLIAAGLFAISLTFRTLDRAVCPLTLMGATWHTGTHALWHALNAVVLYLLLRATANYRAVNYSRHI